MDTLKGKIALITGSSSGMGKAIAIKLGQLGASIALHYSSNREGAKAVKKSIEAYTAVEVFCENFDSENPTLIQKVIKRFGRIDILVNNAGVMNPESFLDVTLEDIENTFKINTITPYIIARDAFNEMQKNKYGRIINISSFTVKYGMGRNNSIHYAASKGALEVITTGLSRLGAEHNILVNTIRPGIINTSMQERPDMESRIEMVPVKRMGTPQEIAEMVAYLAAPTGDFITGQTLSVTGGE